MQVPLSFGYLIAETAAAAECVIVATHSGLMRTGNGNVMIFTKRRASGVENEQFHIAAYNIYRELYASTIDVAPREPNDSINANSESSRS